MHKIWMSLILIFLVGCSVDGNRAVDREKVRQEMKDRQIKRVSEPELMSAAFQTGAELAGVAEKVLLKKIDSFLSSVPSDSSNTDDRTRMPPFGKVVQPVLDSLNSQSDHFLSLISVGVENLHPDTSAVEKQLLEAYQYNLENDISSEDNVQKSGTDHLLFTRPITSKTGICLKVLMANFQSRKPDTLKSQATYFCGMWSIRLSKKEIIKSL